MTDFAEHNRRDFLIRSGGAMAAAVLVPLLPRNAAATPEAMRAAISRIVGEAEIRQGRVKLDIPPLVENGNAVPLTVAVDSPMTEADHVKTLHVVNEKNPQPHVVSVVLGPRAGRATLSIRIRLADSQRVTAIAEMSDGFFWGGSADVVVTLAACVEDLVR
jgi:sulfur-oxidizing protein SoxY